MSHKSIFEYCGNSVYIQNGVTIKKDELSSKGYILNIINLYRLIGQK